MNIIGKMLENRYEIIEKIGIGGMATVYRARCHVLNRDVAVKVLKDEFTTDSEFIQRFNAEAQAAASLTHPNIVSVYDVGNTDDLYYIVMELIEGKTLKEIITEKGKLSWKLTVDIAKQIAQALDAAHKNGIVHRDIKPHNIIITGEGIIKVTDFGIAKAVTNSTVTGFGTTIGSVHYFSPEHAKGGTTDAKSDIYSLGIVMYEMITGKVPFDADTPVSVALKQVQERPVDPIEINPDMPEGLNYLILKTIEKDKSSRYNSARELLEDLDLLTKNPDADFSDTEINRRKVVDYEPDDYEDGAFDKYPWLKPLLLIFLAILTIAIIMGITIFALKQARGEEAFIPNLSGEMNEKRKTVEEASKELETLGFKYEIKEEFDDEVEKGYVIRQDPKFQPNYKIKLNTVIKLFVSKGQEMVKVPEKLEKKEIDDIKSALDEAEVAYEEIEENSEDVEKGKLIKLEYDVNDERMMPKKDKVKIYISKGSARKEVEVPDVVRKDEKEAKEALEKLNLNVKVVSTEDISEPEGKVMAVEPEEGSKLREKDTVTITVNKPPKAKKGLIIVDIASFYPDYEPEEGKDTDKVEVYVSVSGNQLTTNGEKRKKTTTDASYPFSGVYDTKPHVKVTIDGASKDTTGIDLSKKSDWVINNTGAH